MELIKPKVDPAYDEATAKHGAVRAFDEAHSPHDEGQSEDGEWDVAVSDLAERRPVQNVVRHGLLHRNRNSCQVSGKT